jgi:hypothetical protein
MSNTAWGKRSRHLQGRSAEFEPTTPGFATKKPYEAALPVSRYPASRSLPRRCIGHGFNSSAPPAHRITCGERVSGGVWDWRLRAAQAFGRCAWGQPTAVDRDDGRVGVKILCEPGKAWPSNLWVGLGKNSGEGALGYQPRRWSKTNSGTGGGNQPSLGRARPAGPTVR